MHVDPIAPTSPKQEEHPFGKPPKDLPPLFPAPPSRVARRGSVRVEVVDLADRKDRRRFLDVVDAVYPSDPHFIKPLDMERMRFLDTGKNKALSELEIVALIAYRGTRAVGRITAHIDRAYDRHHQTRAGWFGFFESVDDPQVAHALLEDACVWLREKGCDEAIGPCNFTTNHQVGLLVQNFDRPATIEMTYNPPYYEALLRTFGLAKAKDLYESAIDTTSDQGGPRDQKRARIKKIGEAIKARAKVSVRSARMEDFDAEVARIFDLYNATWIKNWGFVPVGRDEFEGIAKDLKQIIVPELVLFVEHEGKPVAFAITLPDVNEIMPRDGRLFPFGWWNLVFGMKKIKSCRLISLGVLPAFRKRGVESLLFIETIERARDKGWASGTIGWTLEDNDLVNRAIDSMDGRVERVYRLLGGALR